jgi:hypothetical protein
MKRYKSVVLILTGILSLVSFPCAGADKMVTRPESHTVVQVEQACFMALGNIRTEIGDFEKALTNYNGTIASVRTAVRKRNESVHTYLSRMKNESIDLNSRAGRIRDSWKRMSVSCTESAFSIRNREELKAVGLQLKGLVASGKLIDCPLCKEIKAPLIIQNMEPSISQCIGNVSSPDKCASFDLNACRSCCMQLPTKAELNNPQDLGSREDCQTMCLSVGMNCERASCKDTGACPYKIPSQTCDKKPCEDCCQQNCPNGAGCFAQCAEKSAMCVIEKMMENQSKTMSGLTGSP